MLFMTVISCVFGFREYVSILVPYEKQSLRSHNDSIETATIIFQKVAQSVASNKIVEVLHSLKKTCILSEKRSSTIISQ